MQISHPAAGRRKFSVLFCEVRPIHWPVALLNPSTMHFLDRPDIPALRRIWISRWCSCTIASRRGLLFLGNLIVQRQRRRIRPPRILEAEHGIVLDFVEQPERRFKILFGLAREPDDDIAGDRDVAAARSSSTRCARIYSSRV